MEKMIEELKAAFAEYEGGKVDINLMDSESGVYSVVVEDFEDFPIAISHTDNTYLCVIKLFSEAEIEDGKKDDLMETCLASNISMPLSHFARFDGHYYLIGSLSDTSKIENIAYEIETMVANIVQALEVVEPYLKH